MITKKNIAWLISVVAISGICFLAAGYAKYSKNSDWTDGLIFLGLFIPFCAILIKLFRRQIAEMAQVTVIPVETSNPI